MNRRSIGNAERLYSKEGEAAVLGSLVLEPSCIKEVLQIVSENDFFLPENKVIFQTVLELHGEKGAVDGLLLRDKLESKELLESVGGLEYIVGILESVPSAANALYYSGIVREKAQLRKTVEAVETMQSALEMNEPIGSIVSRIKQVAEGLSADNGDGRSQPIIKSLSDVEPLPINYLWWNKFPLGMLTILIGDAGLGKSFLSLYMATTVSTGGRWPDGDGLADNFAPKASVVILSAEDDLSHVIRPRLDAMGADCTKIIAIEGVRRYDDDGRLCPDSFNFQDDLPALQKAVSALKDCKLVVIDPLSAYLGGNLDSHRDADVRRVLMPLVQFAEDNNVAIIGVMHLNKNAGVKVVYRALGSVAFTAAARTVWLLSSDPDNPDSRRRLLTPAKHNVLINPTGLSFEIRDSRVEFENEPVTMTADEALRVSTVEAPLLNKATEWLMEQLPPGKSLASTELSKLAQENGITESTLRRAKQELKAISYPMQVNGRKVWFVRLPGVNEEDAQHNIYKQQYSSIDNNTQVGLLA